MRFSSITFFLAFTAGVQSAFPQERAHQPSSVGMMRQQQTISGGVGMTVIEGKPYYLVHFTPELIFGKVGIGLGINVRIGEDGKVRREDFDEAYDYLRLIRYIRYGSKHDPFYARAGAIDYARLGHGSIVYLYRNSPGYESRLVGLELDADFDRFGFEALAGNVAGAGVIGIRTYVRPLQFTPAADVPVLGRIHTGATIASDFHSNAWKTWGDASGSVDRAHNGGALSIVGVDVGLPLLSLEVLRSTLYADFAKILDFGSGTAVGVELDFTGLGLVTLAGKYERRFAGDRFIPAYFDALYERERFTRIDSVRFMSKAQRLKSAPRFEGFYGELGLNILGTFLLVGGYASPLGRPHEGILHLELESGSVLPGISLSGGYDRRNVGAAFKLDNNSVLYGQVGYRPAPYLLVSILYEWTFIEEKSARGEVTGYKPQRRVEPRIGFVVMF